jgi:hypothetical protein
VPLLVSLAGERVIYLALELDRRWTETAVLISALLLAILISIKAEKNAAVSDEPQPVMARLPWVRTIRLHQLL